MDFFEWMYRSSDHGPVGSVDVGKEKRIVVWLPFTLVRFLLTFALLVGSIVVGVFHDVTPQPLHGALAGGVFLLYLCVGYFIRPKPDLSNVGYAGGLVDDPFRYSDDRNRSLLFFAILLLPGYLLARPVVELFAYIAGEDEG